MPGRHIPDMGYISRFFYYNCAMSQHTRNLFHQTQFLTSAAKVDQCPTDTGLEIAFAGRSNSGKSSAINTITAQGKLAKTSKTPGRTQLLNFFQVNSPEQRLVDLPGYGYARVPLAEKRKWEIFIDDYLRERNSLCGLVLIMDIRRPLTEFDQTILQWARQCELQTHILLSKADKLNFGTAKASLLQVQKELRNQPLISVQLFSATKYTGVDDARTLLGSWLQMHQNSPN